MNEGVALVLEVDPSRIARRLETRYLDESAPSLDEALARADRYKRDGVARSIGWRRTRPTCSPNSWPAA
jgi:urocanate hydratase